MHRSFVAHGIAVAAVAFAVLLRWGLDPLLGNALPLVTLFGAVAVAVWVAGWRTAAAAALGYAACDLLFISPRGQFGSGGTTSSAIGLVAYLLTSALIIAIGEAARRARRRAGERGELLAVTLGSIGDAVIATDNEARVTTLNPVAETLTGWPLAEARGQPLERIFRIVDEATRAPAANPALRTLQQGVVVGLANHTLLIARDGSERAIDDSAAPIRDMQGAIRGCVLVFRDISDRRRAERDDAGRLEAARLLAAIVESSDDAIISKSLDGTIRSWNAAAERLFGHRAEDAIGRHISLVIPPERVAEEDQIIASLCAGRRIDHFETERMRSDGQLVRVSLTISPIRNAQGEVVGASKIVRDVTEQRRTEQRERQLTAEATAANAKFRAFFDQGRLLAAIVDVDGTVLEPNRASWEGCGYSREQIVGRPFWQGPWWAGSAVLAETLREGIAGAAAGRPFNAELPYRLADGTERVADLTILPITAADGRVLFLAPTASDITERRRAEDERAGLAAGLALADRRKDEFLATLAHELRNPLAPLTHTLAILERAGADPITRALGLETMQRQLAQMVRLVDDLLDLNRITHDRLELRCSGLELADVVRQAAQATQPLADAARHTLVVSLPGRPLPLSADAVRLVQVFGNLLHNACKYTPDGGRIEIAAEREGDHAVVTVSDTGNGIPDDKLDSIFDMFTQVDRSIERTQGGLGIGLTLVRRLVQLHGGTVEARSAGAGRGSAFVVRLPLAAAAPATAFESAGAPADAPPRRVLVVDDNVDAAASLAALLELAGHEVFVAHDGIAALAAAEAHRPEVVLLDIGLPRLNGYEVCRRLRQTPWGASIKVVALTGWGQHDDRRQSREAGFDDHLVKPVDLDTLSALLGGRPG